MTLIYGVGINDASYPTQKRLFGKCNICPFFLRWKNMLARCYWPKFQEKNPSYAGCSVVDEWLMFSNFKLWMEQQDWQGKYLDKDILIPGNKVYGPDTCAFVDRDTNQFLNERSSRRGIFPLGVSWHKRLSRFHAKCGNLFTKRREHLGYFDCPHEAHQAWRKRKHELAVQLAEKQTDERVKAALLARYQ